MNIAQTIWNQIIAGGQVKVMSWGVPMKSRVGCQEEGWLKFKVNGMKFKGTVKVTYVRCGDHYKVEFIKESKKKDELSGLMIPTFETVETKDGIYCDMLNRVIDEYVEKIDAYRF